MKVLPGLTAYEEIKLDDVPLGTDLRQLLVLAFDKALLWTLNADQVGCAMLQHMQIMSNGSASCGSVADGQ
jgi:hypothetical protein